MEQKSQLHEPVVLKFGRFILKRRSLVFLFSALIVLVAEIIEHWPATLAFDKHFVNEIFFYGFVGPLILWGILTMLHRALYLDEPIEQIRASVSQAERRRIARDLHDSLAQKLGYLHLKLDQLATSDDATLTDIESIHNDLEKMRQIADLAYQQVRGTLDSLWDDTYVSSNLAAALHDEAQKITNGAGLEIKFNFDNDGPRCPIVKSTMIDITREALANITQHAEASQVTIKLRHHQGEVALIISDDGKGFDPGRFCGNTGHYGLTIMRERAEEIGGQLSVETALGAGTQLRVHLPTRVACEMLIQRCEDPICQRSMKCSDENSFG